MGRNIAKYLALLSQIGLTMVLALGLTTFGGYWLDQRFDTSPWFLMTGLILGAAGGLKAIVDLMTDVDRVLKKPPAKDDRRMDDEQE